MTQPHYFRTMRASKIDLLTASLALASTNVFHSSEAFISNQHQQPHCRSLPSYSTAAFSNHPAPIALRTALHVEPHQPPRGCSLPFYSTNTGQDCSEGDDSGRNEQHARSRKFNPDVDTRRKFLSETAAILSIIGSAEAAHAEGLVKEDGKIALRTSTTNIPVRYVGTSADATPASVTPDTTTYCGPDPEERRISVFERAAPSVVYIDTFVEARDAFSPNVMEVPLGAGSGFVWDDKGHIVTNYHVVRNSAQAQVAILTKVLPNAPPPVTPSPSMAVRNQKQDMSQYRTSMRPTSLGSDLIDYTRKIYKAKVVGVDPGKDIAVLKVDAPVYDLYPIEVGTSTGLRVGQGCLAIGNPFGLDHTLTSGIISGMGREIKSPIGRPISNVIQTDAAINPGNSGGPLLDAKTGKLIGMSTAIYSTSGASAGIGFAIPIDSVRYIVETLIRDGRVIRPVLGVSLLESKQARALGINKGVLVLDVPSSSPAFKAGMKGTTRTEAGLIEIGDIIVKVDDKSIDTEADLFQALETYKPGDRIKVTVNRPGNESPTSTKIKLKEVVLTVQLISSDMIKGMNFKAARQN